MLDLFKKKPCLDEPTTQWLFDVFAWAQRNYDADVFYNEIILVTPSNAHFPGRENSVHGMANLIFNQVRQHAGLSHWPCRLVDGNDVACEASPDQQVTIHGALWGSGGRAEEEDDNRIIITYNPDMIGNPEGMIADFAHQLAYHFGTMAKEPAPGGEENRPHVAEVLALFLGFGLMFANSALVVKTGCGGCGGAAANRHNFLGQFDMTYALAIFCVLKQIPLKEVTRHLKPSLRSYFKQAMKEVAGREAELERVRNAAQQPSQH